MKLYILRLPMLIVRDRIRYLLCDTQWWAVSYNRRKDGNIFISPRNKRRKRSQRTHRWDHYKRKWIPV